MSEDHGRYVSPITGKNHGVSNWVKDPEDHKRRRKDWYNKARFEAIMHYGGKCACCGESTYEFLCLDHSNGGGNQHRKEVKASALDRKSTRLNSSHVKI